MKGSNGNNLGIDWTTILQMIQLSVHSGQCLDNLQWVFSSTSTRRPQLRRYKGKDLDLMNVSAQCQSVKYIREHFLYPMQEAFRKIEKKILIEMKMHNMIWTNVSPFFEWVDSVRAKKKGSWETMVDNLDFFEDGQEPIPGFGNIQNADDVTKEKLKMGSRTRVINKILFAVRCEMFNDILAAIREFGFDPELDSNCPDSKINRTVKAYQQ